MKMSTKELIICGLFASITSILAQISIPLPFTTVPLTMQVFAVALCGLILGPKLGFISQVIYILIGAIGMPVFAQMSGGISSIIGRTGGFILSFPIVALVVGYFSKKYSSLPMIVVGMILGLITSYTIGTLQFTLIMKVSFIEGLTLCVIPFVLVDLMKIGLATIIGVSVSKRVGMGMKTC
ncbi:biotin transporter BioY [Romboutsia sp.]|uniref:biotin transporter BioY n=1 Tax=Romboutsia sp. TaxID=1965302 RepID=UPI003F32956A